MGWLSVSVVPYVLVRGSLARRDLRECNAVLEPNGASASIVSIKILILVGFYGEHALRLFKQSAI